MTTGSYLVTYVLFLFQVPQAITPQYSALATPAPLPTQPKRFQMHSNCPLYRCPHPVEWPLGFIMFHAAYIEIVPGQDSERAPPPTYQLEDCFGLHNGILGAAR